MKLSKQQKAILGWAYVISQKEGDGYWNYWQDRGIHLKPIRIVIINTRGHKHPTRSESASISRSFTRLHKAGLIDIRYLHRFFLTIEGKKISQNYATPTMWKRLSHLKDRVPAIDIKG